MKMENMKLNTLADGGAWKNEARLSIKEYLENELTDALADDRILIIG